MKKLICKIFGHKHIQSIKGKRGITTIYGNTICLRCGYNPQSKQKVYFSGSPNITNWDMPNTVDLTKSK